MSLVINDKLAKFYWQTAYLPNHWVKTWNFQQQKELLKWKQSILPNFKSTPLATRKKKILNIYNLYDSKYTIQNVTSNEK